MERMASKKKTNESAGGSAKKIRKSGGDAVEFLKEKAQSEYSIRQRELELQRKGQEAIWNYEPDYSLNCTTRSPITN